LVSSPSGHRTPSLGGGGVLTRPEGHATSRPRRTPTLDKQRRINRDPKRRESLSAAKHPAWFINLARNPDQAEIELGGRTTNVTPESLVGPERADAWQRVIKASPGFVRYEQMTDRLIPVVRLTAVS
jgi:deazaflavin-dependent oxidoreductase (nitroreductase family)